MKCQFCEKLARPGTSPALCWEHLDLAILVDFLADIKRQPVTVENAQALLSKSLAKGGEWQIGLDDVPRLMAGEFARGVVVRE